MIGVMIAVTTTDTVLIEKEALPWERLFDFKLMLR